MEQHFVNYYSPGTMVSETSSRPIDSWDSEKAIEMVKDIQERHGATPYGFKFTTRSRRDDDLDSSESASSGMYYLGGVVETLKEVRAKNNPDDRILISNMECNGYDKIITNCNSYRFTTYFTEDDVLLDYKAPTKGPNKC